MQIKAWRSASLCLLLALFLVLGCSPNPQPEGLTPILTLASVGEATLEPALQGTPQGGDAAATRPPPQAGDAEKGAAVFAQNCAGCHGANAEGGSVGPSLVAAQLKAESDQFFRDTITNGVAGTAMPAWGGRLSAQEIADVIAFVRSKQGS
jgi:mono/diheme cytochrome c family protein